MPTAAEGAKSAGLAGISVLTFLKNKDFYKIGYKTL